MPEPGYGALAALAAFIVASVWLGSLAHRVVQRGSFVKGYFLGNRGLGAWAVALTATVQSGGTFMGYPSLVYSFGWIVFLWIASYMVVPIAGFGVLAKRLAQLSRRTGAITIPDLFRERFGSPAVGLAASLFILAFMTVMMVAQFKAGANVMKIAWPGTGALALSDDPIGGIDPAYYVGLGIFTLTVVGYTLIGGFLAAVWTDLFQSVMMLIGVVTLLCLTVPAAGGLEHATREAVRQTGPGYASGPGFSPDGREFLPVGLAFSYFIIWTFGGLASPSSVVRVMACKSTETLRRSIVMLSVYNCLIYIPLAIIAVCGRALIPKLTAEKSDEFIPRLAFFTTSELPGGSFVAGLILAAPFGAVMATVSSYLVVIASGLVRDIYQRFINPEANQDTIRRLSYLAMIGVGAVALALNIDPVVYLQALVVFSTTGTASSLLIPLFMAVFWRRATAAGTLAAMVCGAAVTLTLYIIGWISPDQMIGEKTDIAPYYLLKLHPIIWGLTASAVAGIGVSLRTRPPEEKRVAWCFEAGAPPPASL